MIVFGFLVASLWHKDHAIESTETALMETIRLGLDAGGVTTRRANAFDKTKQVGKHYEGWNPIHVFYGKMNHITDEINEKYYLKDVEKNKNGKVFFGQHGQDVAVLKFFNFKKDGFFVDLAANDAVWASNTFALEQNFDWKGICIEPNPDYWYRLAFRKCHAIGAIIGGTDFEEVKVRLPAVTGDHTSALGGIVGSEFDNKRVRNKQDEKVRYTASLKTIFEMMDAPKVIDYLSLDVEGAETFIMRGFPFDEYTFLALSVERPKEELQTLLQSKGYSKLLDFKRGDTLWAHESVYEYGKANLQKTAGDINSHNVDVSMI